MDNFLNDNNLYVNNDQNDDENYQDPSLDLYNPFLMNQMSQMNLTDLNPIQQNFDDFTPEMLFNMGMKSGNMHSALFNHPSKQLFNPLNTQLFNQNNNPNNLLFTNTTDQMMLKNNNLLSNTLIQPQLQPIKVNNHNTTGIYSSTGFDLLSILCYIPNRPNPVVNIGPVDLSCAFLLVDARQPDFPIVYASPTFESLTGYTPNECVGRNCRFLQAPDGRVTEGSHRKFSDNNSIFMFKSKILAVQEHQASLVNYKKNGQAFFNLVTIIPIIEGGSVNFFVGLQVDLVDQPNAIIDNMKNSAFSINYGKPTFTKTIPEVSNKFEDLPSSLPYENLASIFENDINFNSDNSKSEAVYREWIKYILNQCNDFVYVLSLKGTFLYASPSSKRLLGYEPEELVGQNLSKICHPGDLVPTLRELKEIANNETSVEITFRFRPKNINNDEYLWLESNGKLHGDLGKGRRCIVLTGRQRQMFKLSSSSIIETGGELGDNDVIMKLSNDGIILHVSSNFYQSLGFDQQEIIGTTLYQLLPADRSYTLTTALEQVCKGISSKLYHHIQNKRGSLLVANSYFFPGHEPQNVDEKVNFILARINISINSPPKEQLVDYKVEQLNSNPFKSSEDIFKFNENNPNSSWQYELHQLKLKNKKLKENISILDPITKNKKKRNLNKKAKACMSCNRTSTTEWRRGPNGPSTLCNPCGLKYSKEINLQKTSKNSGDTVSSNSI